MNWKMPSVASAALAAIIGDKADTITNKGSIVGNVSTDAGNDVLNNAGSIKGDVSLGAGDDIANWTGDLTSAQRVDGGAGTDALNFDVVMSGTVKASFVNFETASGQILGQGGNDVIDLSSLKATGSLKLAGGDGNDIILGGTTDDLLIGGRGNDVLNGGAGKNVLIGGEGADTFILSTIKPDGGHDQIKDFETGIDTLQIDTKVFTALANRNIDGHLPEDAALKLGEILEVQKDYKAAAGVYESLVTRKLAQPAVVGRTARGEVGRRGSGLGGRMAPRGEVGHEIRPASVAARNL